MWNKREIILAILAFSALYYKVTGKLLDMAPDAVDDRYELCRKEVLEKYVLPDLLKQELNQSEPFQKAWSARKCSELIIGGTKEHTAALLAIGDKGFTETFNKAVETLGTNVSTYKNHFHFKSLHFLLMDSMSLLNPKCTTLYSVSEQKYTAVKGSKVRFGRFTQAYTNYQSAKKWHDFDDGSLVVFNITSCFFANLGKSVCGKEEDLVLLSPAEVFTVEEVIKVDNDDDAYTAIVLKHSGWNSTHNCDVVSRSRAPTDVSTQWLVLALVASSFFFSFFSS